MELNKKQKQEIYDYGYNYIDVQVPATIALHKKEFARREYRKSWFVVVDFLRDCAINNYEEYANANTEVPEIRKETRIDVEYQINKGSNKAVKQNKEELKKLFLKN